MALEAKLNTLLLAIDQCLVPHHPICAKDDNKLTQRQNYKVDQQNLSLDNNNNTSHTHSHGESNSCWTQISHDPCCLSPHQSYL